VVRKNFQGYFQMMRMDRPIGFYLLLWPTLWALWIAAHGFPQMQILVVMILGVAVMRALGCTLNDWADRNFDGLVARTKNRPLPQGLLKKSQVFALMLVLASAAFALAWQLNSFAFSLAFPGLAIAAVYPYCKRFFQAPQLWLGLAFAWSIPMAFAAVQNHLPAEAYGLFCIALLWPVAYDTMYALADIEDDKKIGLHSLAITLGARAVPWTIGLQRLIYVLFWMYGYYFSFVWGYYLCLCLALPLILFQEKCLRIQTPKSCMQAFRSNGYFGALVFLGIVFNYL
jgi:4-hydroxybenzoate polyprenyltransferase